MEMTQGTTQVSNGIQRLLPRHHGILRLVLAGTHSRKEIAEMLGYTPENVSLVIDSPLFQMELSRRRADLERTETIAVRDGLTQARDLLNQNAVAAVETLERAMAEGDLKIGIDAADKILKYAFPKSQDLRGGQTTQVVALSEEKLSRLREALSECGFVSEQIKTVESVVVENAA
jgi:DNA-binding MarR family transcriptional regulator